MVQGFIRSSCVVLTRDFNMNVVVNILNVSNLFRAVILNKTIFGKYIIFNKNLILWKLKP